MPADGPSAGMTITGCVIYCQTSGTLVGIKIVDHPDIVGALPVSTATSSFSTLHMASMDWPETIARRYERHFSCGIWCVSYIRGLTVLYVWGVREGHPMLLQPNQECMNINITKMSRLIIKLNHRVNSFCSGI